MEKRGLNGSVCMCMRMHTHLPDALISSLDGVGVGDRDDNRVNT